MKKNNKRAFSLVELLAVIVIVGILFGVAIAVYSRYIDKARNARDDSNRNTAKMAAELYVQSNKNALPSLIGESSKIDFYTLRKLKYLKDDITNSKGDSCMEHSFVRIYKLSNNEYSYYTFLYCGDEEAPADEDVPQPVIEDFKYSGGTFTSGSFNDVKDARFSFTMRGSDHDDLGIYSYQYAIFVNTGDNDVFSEVYNSGNIKGGFEKSLIITSKQLSNYMNITSYTSIKVIVTVVNEQGGKIEYTSLVGDYEDNIPPSCINVLGAAKDDNDWINKSDYATREAVGNDRKGIARISVGCNDGSGSGCKRDQFTRTWPNDDMSDSGKINYKYGTRWGYVKIEDNAKKINSTKCYVRANVDLQAPKIILTAYSKNGTTKTKVAELTVQDTTSINNKAPEGTIYAGDYSNLVGSSSEKWMNNANYKDGLEIDIKISDNLYLYSYTWEVNDQNVPGGTSNNVIKSTANLNNANDEQGKNGTKASNNFTYNVVDNPTNPEELALAEHGLLSKEVKGLKLTREGKRYGKLTVCDKSGNCSIINIYANIDRTAPATPTVSYIKKGTTSSYTPATADNYLDHNRWSNKNIRAYINEQRKDNNPGKGELSGWDHFDYIYRKQTGKTNGVIVWNNPSKVRVSPSGDNYQYGFDINDQGTHIVKFDSCDRAGNCSVMSTDQYVKVDTIKPTCTINKTYNGTTGPNSEGWLKKGESVTFSHNCKDEDSKFSSGCDSSNADNKETHTYATNIQTTKAGVRGDNAGGYVWDYAGNKSNECPKNETVKIDINPPTCQTRANYDSTSGTSYSGSWTTKNVVITGVCSDTGGSTCKANPTTKYSSDIDENVSFTKNVEDKAGNKTACNGTHKVRIDLTKPKGTCTIVGSYTTDTNQSYTIRVDTKEDPKKNNAASGIKTIKYQRTGDTSFGTSNKMNLACSKSGKKEGWIQITDNVGNTSGAIKCEGYIDVPTCCSKVTYENGTKCTAKCDGGTYNRIAYSFYNGSRCSSKDTSSGGSACNTRQCCGSNAVFDHSTKCTKSCGGGKTTYYYVSKYDSSHSCGSKKYDCNTQSCGPIGNVCNVRGKTKKSVSTWSGCTAGDGPHSTAYIHYCWDGSKYVTKGQNPSLNTYWYVCPAHPYGTGQGWTIIDD